MCCVPCAMSCRASTREDSRQGGQEDPQVKNERLPCDILQIKSHHLLEGDLTAPAHLPQACQARDDRQTSHVMWLIEGHLVGEGGAWPHQAHLATDDVPQLWDFVKAGAPEDATHAGDAGVCLEFVAG